MSAVQYINKILFKGGVYEQKNQHISTVKKVSTLVDSQGNQVQVSIEKFVDTSGGTVTQKLADAGYDITSSNVKVVQVTADSFTGTAFTKFNVSDFAQVGDKITILHYNETDSKWEVVGDAIVDTDGNIYGEFTSFSPVAFVKSANIPTEAGLYDMYINPTTSKPVYVQNLTFYDFLDSVYPVGTRASYLGRYTYEGTDMSILPVSQTPLKEIKGLLKVDDFTNEFKDDAFSFDNNIIGFDSSNATYGTTIHGKNVFSDSVKIFFFGGGRYKDVSIDYEAFSAEQMKDIVDGNIKVYMDDRITLPEYGIFCNGSGNDSQYPIFSSALDEWRNSHLVDLDDGIDGIHHKMEYYKFFVEDFFIFDTVDKFYEDYASMCTSKGNFNPTDKLFKYFSKYRIENNKIIVQSFTRLLYSDNKNYMLIDTMGRPWDLPCFDSANVDDKVYVGGLEVDMETEAQVDLTQNEFKSLSAEEKNNGKIYFMSGSPRSSYFMGRYGVYGLVGTTTTCPF